MLQPDFQPSFERFINTINKEQAKDLVRSINLFMRNFRMKEVDSDSDSKDVQDFLAYMANTAFPKHPLWANSSHEDLESAIEGLEKYLLTKLFDRTFGVDALDRERDTAIGLRLQALQFIRPEHLEIASDFANDAALLLAQKELAKINMFKSPRDKLSCILSCCRVINNLLASKKYGAGADDFTPVLIYVTIKASPDAMASNLAFIERFRMASRIVSEVSYMFVQMQSAVAFVETLDVRTSLKVDQDELIAHMLAAGAFTDADLAMLQQPEQPKIGGPALQSQSSEQAAVVAVEAAEAQAADKRSKQAGNLIDFGDAEPEPPPLLPPPSSNGDWLSSVQAAGGGAHAHAGVSQSHSRSPSQSSSTWHSRTPSTTFANLLDSEQPTTNPLLWNDPFQQHQLQLQQQPQPHPPQPHPYLPHQLASAPSLTFPQPHTLAAGPPQYPSWPNSAYAGLAPSPQCPVFQLHKPGAFAPTPGFIPPPPSTPPPPISVPPPPPPPPPPSLTADQPLARADTSTLPNLHGLCASASELEAQGVQLLTAANAAGELQERYPLLYASVDAITLADVRKLLDQYKELVIKYESLALAVNRQQPTTKYQAHQPHQAPRQSSHQDPAASFFATSMGVPLTLASSASGSTAASAVQRHSNGRQQTNSSMPPPPPVHNEHGGQQPLPSEQQQLESKYQHEHVQHPKEQQQQSGGYNAQDDLVQHKKQHQYDNECTQEQQQQQQQQRSESNAPNKHMQHKEQHQHDNESAEEQQEQPQQLQQQQGSETHAQNEQTQPKEQLQHDDVQQESNNQLLNGHVHLHGSEPAHRIKGSEDHPHQEHQHACKAWHEQEQDQGQHSSVCSQRNLEQERAAGVQQQTGEKGLQDNKQHEGEPRQVLNSKVPEEPVSSNFVAEEPSAAVDQALSSGSKNTALEQTARSAVEDEGVLLQEHTFGSRTSSSAGKTRIPEQQEQGGVLGGSAAAACSDALIAAPSRGPAAVTAASEESNGSQTVDDLGFEEFQECRPDGQQGFHESQALGEDDWYGDERDPFGVGSGTVDRLIGQVVQGSNDTMSTCAGASQSLSSDLLGS